MSEENIRCPKCGSENTFDSNSQNKLYCRECGKKLSKYVLTNENSAKRLMFPFIVEIIAFLIVAIIFSIIFGACTAYLSASFHPVNYDRDIINFQSIQDTLSLFGILISSFIGALIGAMFIFCNWSVFKFNRLEKRILELQEKLGKE